MDLWEGNIVEIGETIDGMDGKGRFEMFIEEIAELETAGRDQIDKDLWFLI